MYINSILISALWFPFSKKIFDMEHDCAQFYTLCFFTNGPVNISEEVELNEFALKPI